MKTLFLILILAMGFIPLLSRAEDVPFGSDDLNSTNPLERKRNRRPPPPPPSEEKRVEIKVDREEPPPERPIRRRQPKEEAPSVFGRELPWWDARGCKNAIGFEAPTPGTSTVLGNGAVTYGGWFSELLGVDVYLGVSRVAGDFKDTTTVLDNSTAKTHSTTTVYSGRNKSTSFALGVYLKVRAYSNSWFTLHLGPTLAISPASKAASSTGSVTETTANTDTPGNRTITQTAFGTINESRSTVFSIGPKVGAEFYLKWVPHLAIGMSTGILAVTGGTTTETTTTANRTIPVVADVPQDPGAVPVTTQTVTTPRSEVSTFGLGGTTFSLTGTFTIRYIF